MWLRARTKLLLKQPWYWRAVEDLARVLLERREVRGHAARRICEAAFDTYARDEAERAAMDAAAGWEAGQAVTGSWPGGGGHP